MSKPKHQNSNGGLRRKVKRIVFARDDICWLCLEPVDKTLPKCTPRSPELDEEVPFSKGGSSTDPGNVNLVHRACNLKKGNRILPRGAFAGHSPIHDGEHVCKGGKGGTPTVVKPLYEPVEPVKTSINWLNALVGA